MSSPDPNGHLEDRDIKYPQMGREKEDFPEYFLENVKKPVMTSVPLRDYSNFKIGGNADYFFEATSMHELVTAVLCSREVSIPLYIIGGGYNLLFDDNGFRGLIIKNAVKGINRRENSSEVDAFAGAPLEDLLRFSVEQGLSGLEFMAGIPGTIGGAVSGNAGAFKQSIGEYVKEGLLLDQSGEQVQVGRDYFEFRYRHSILKKKHELLLKVVFELHDGDKESIQKLIEENLETRKEKHPHHDLPCAGSYFKNPVLPDGRIVPAAYFLEKVGAKTMKVGGAAVYSGHSNFIINQENALAKDVFRLAQELKQRVKERFDIELEEEVIFLPASPSTP
jgi:UDP-N-acetylmuramate dehydrogenase